MECGVEALQSIKFSKSFKVTLWDGSSSVNAMQLDFFEAISLSHNCVPTYVF